MNYDEFRKRFQWNGKTDKLGEGGFGKVFRAFDTARNRFVVLKVADVPSDHKFSLQRETELNHELTAHPNIAQYRNCYRLEDSHGDERDYAIMDYFPDGSLAKVMDQSLGYEAIHDIVDGMLRGLVHLEREQVIHRDFKPGNVLMARDEGRWQPKIADFGLSRFTDIDTGVSNSSIGISYDYAAPEQFESGLVNRQADLWALGVIVYRLCTGRLPFQVSAQLTGESRRIALIQLINKAQLPKDIDDIDEPYQTMIRWCLVRELNDRVKSAEDLLKLMNRKTFTPEVKLPFFLIQDNWTSGIYRWSFDTSERKFFSKQNIVRYRLEGFNYKPEHSDSKFTSTAKFTVNDVREDTYRWYFKKRMMNGEVVRCQVNKKEVPSVYFSQAQNGSLYVGEEEFENGKTATVLYGLMNDEDYLGADDTFLIDGYDFIYENDGKFIPVGKEATEAYSRVVLGDQSTDNELENEPDEDKNVSVKEESEVKPETLKKLDWYYQLLRGALGIQVIMIAVWFWMNNGIAHGVPASAQDSTYGLDYKPWHIIDSLLMVVTVFTTVIVMITLNYVCSKIPIIKRKPRVVWIVPYVLSAWIALNFPYIEASAGKGGEIVINAFFLGFIPFVLGIISYRVLSRLDWYSSFLRGFGVCFSLFPVMAFAIEMLGIMGSALAGFESPTREIVESVVEVRNFFEAIYVLLITVSFILFFFSRKQLIQHVK